ncbi:1-propanol dehydrogenase PduQ [Acerihabitans arboris]|uniref:Iron-containing alcohol dehydrogenase n=1 Tax=Acerihabitans arboris TaxID=2691583 RepID=A0A845SPW3_9GAMM|nr:1-propanol dehydrogenase PduQ [Acerihabitans arboris]NDL63205.1 iron-containing alcohol dehydrogenase [Acerihabitans arboris]
MKRFVIPTRVYSGTDSLRRLERYRDKKTWVVCDGFLAKGGAIARLLEHLDADRVTLFSDIMPDPPIATVVAGIERLQTVRPQVVVGFGGGSAIDAAKAMVFFGRRAGIAIDTFIAIPTTSGTGSEVTSASVISDPVLGIKYPLFNDEIYPDIALLDPQLVVSVPPAVTANTGMDVLTHAIEAYVSTGASDFSDALAEKAAQMVFRHLPDAFATGNCLRTREKMHNASTLAGMAFSQAGLGLNHAIAHQFGGQLHVAHGLANALLLAEVIRFNSQDARAAKKYARLARLCGLAAHQSDDRAGLNQLLNHIGLLKRQVGIPSGLGGLAIGAEKIRLAEANMIRAALNDATLTTNPRPATDNDIAAIIHAVI